MNRVRELLRPILCISIIRFRPSTWLNRYVRLVQLRKKQGFSSFPPVPSTHRCAVVSLERTSLDFPILLNSSCVCVRKSTGSELVSESGVCNRSEQRWRQRSADLEMALELARDMELRNEGWCNIAVCMHTSKYSKQHTVGVAILLTSSVLQEDHVPGFFSAGHTPFSCHVVA